jgi:hypothetical protein
MRKPMTNIAPYVCHQQCFNELKVTRLRGDRRMKTRAYQSMKNNCSRPNEYKDACIDQKPVDKKMHDVGSPSTAKHALLRAQCEETLERNENQRRHNEAKDEVSPHRAPPTDSIRKLWRESLPCDVLPNCTIALRVM